MTPKGESKLRAVGYCRTSSEGQRDNTSIPTQRAAIEAFCKHSEWKFLNHYIDESKTGSKIAGRDAFQQMLKDAALEKFDIIVPFDVSRFARDGVDILDNAKFLRTNFNVHIVDTKGGFDSRPSANVLMNFVHAGMSEFERKNIMQRMIGGRVQNAQNGLPWSGKKPFGRTFDPATGKWFVNERGKRFRKMLERYVNGEGFTALLKEFTEFSCHAVVLSYIRNSKISGPYVKTFNVPDINLHVEVPIPEIPEVVPEKLMKRVLARLEHRRTWNQEHRRRYVLTGFVKCGHCGTAMTGNCTAGRIYYRHCNPKKDCSFFHSIKKEEFADPVLDYLFSFFTDEPAFDQAIARALPKEDERTELESRRDALQATIAETQKKIGRLINAVTKGADPTLLIGKQTELKEQAEQEAERLREIEMQLQQFPDKELLRHQIAALRLQILAKVQNRDWRKLSFEEVHRFMIFLFGENPKAEDNGITIYREKGRWRITFKGRIEFDHELANGKPLSKLMKRAVSDHNRRSSEFVALTRQT